MPAPDGATDGAGDLILLEQAARAAGQLALTFSGPSTRRWEKPAGAGPVTEADLAVNALLREKLRIARPDYGWLSEEDPDSATRLNAGTVFIVDPIDGTRSFIDGSKTWAHSLAIARNGRIVAGVVYLPAREKLYSAALGHGAQLNGRPITTSVRAGLSGAAILATRPTLDPSHWQGRVPEIARGHRPSLAYRLCLVAEGRFDAMLTLRDSWEWDIAAGSLICAEAGATTSDRNGRMLMFNAPHPATPGILTGAPPIHAGLLAALRPAP